MDSQRHWLGAAVARLVRQMPPAVASAFADAIHHGLPEDRASLPRHLPHPEFRESAARFLEAWRIKAPDLPGEAVSLALISAAHLQSIHDEQESREIVWTGPATSGIPFRQTEQAILEVIDSAVQRLSIVSYAVYRIPRIREALIAAVGRGVRIRLIVETPNRIEGQGEYDCLLALGGDVASACSVYYWPQDNRPTDENGKIGILHVKCAVADGHRMFLSSANFTEYAFTINMELGLLVTGGKLPARVESHFGQLIESGCLVRV